VARVIVGFGLFKTDLVVSEWHSRYTAQHYRGVVMLMAAPVFEGFLYDLTSGDRTLLSVCVDGVEPQIACPKRVPRVAISMPLNGRLELLLRRTTKRPTKDHPPSSATRDHDEETHSSLNFRN